MKELREQQKELLKIIYKIPSFQLTDLDLIEERVNKKAIELFNNW